jgi:tripartite-type tricarboxylate transporter receptor subunit TctC
VMPYSAGGPNDVLGRNLASHMGKFLGAPVIVTNVPGAGGTIGFKRIADAKPDGYTLLIANVGISAASAIYGKPELDPRVSLIPTGMIASTPITINVRKQFPAETLQQFIDYAKKNPGKVTMGTAGSGSGSHLTSAYFNAVAGIEPTFVPYKGTGPALQDVIAGTIDTVQDLSVSTIPLHKAGSIRMLAVSSAKRLPALPDVPTTAEAGLPDFQASGWSGLFLPKGTPLPIVRRIEAALASAHNNAQFRNAVINNFNSEMPGPGLNASEGFSRFVDEEVRRWSKVVNDIGIKPNQ